MAGIFQKESRPSSRSTPLCRADHSIQKLATRINTMPVLLLHGSDEPIGKEASVVSSRSPVISADFPGRTERAVESGLALIAATLSFIDKEASRAALLERGLAYF